MKIQTLGQLRTLLQCADNEVTLSVNELWPIVRRAEDIEEAAEKVLRRFGDEYEGRLADLRAALDDKETT